VTAVKKITILGSLILSVGAILCIYRAPTLAFAESALLGQPTPRVYITQIPSTLPPKPSQPAVQPTLAPTEQNTGSPTSTLTTQSKVLSLSVASDALIQNVFDQRKNDPANRYIYNFFDAYQPLTEGGGCAAVWDVVPQYSTLPNWLLTPGDATQIYSKINLNFLAGMLIQNKVVDASSCLNGGILPENRWVANACGLSKAIPSVLAWQNSFNQVIFDVSTKSGVPAQLMKNMFSRESQFWPGIYSNAAEAGLGQLTVNGADTLLMWNSNFYKQFCPQVLIAEACRNGYTKLSVTEQQLLTGALVRMVNATCANCPGGIDPTTAAFSVQVFAENLVANCEQVGRIIENVSLRKPKYASSYEDLWKFTLLNYHAGAGCLSDAVREVTKTNYDVTWDLVAAHLPSYCASAKAYVEEVIFMPEIAPIPPAVATPIGPTPTPNPTPTPTPTSAGKS
jgi:hypothetical protein